MPPAGLTYLAHTILRIGILFSHFFISIFFHRVRSVGGKYIFLPMYNIENSGRMRVIPRHRSSTGGMEDGTIAGGAGADNEVVISVRPAPRSTLCSRCSLCFLPLLSRLFFCFLFFSFFFWFPLPSLLLFSLHNVSLVMRRSMRHFPCTTPFPQRVCG